MAFVNAKTGKKIKLDTGYTSNPIDYQTWKRQQEAKRAEGQPSARPSSAVSSPAKDAGKAKRDASTATAIKAPVQRWENQLRQAQVDQNTDVILRLNKKLKEERARNPSSGGYSLSRGVADIFKKGANQVAQAGANTLALAEDVVNAPFELFSGMELGSLRNSGQGIFNPLREKVQEEGAALAEKSAVNVRKGGKGAALLDKYGTATVAAVPQSVIAMLTGGTSTAAQAAAQTSAGVARQAAEALSPGIARTLQTVAGNLSRDPQFWSSFSQVVGSGYQEALEDGASVPKAALYAVGNGLMNAAVEVGGGVQTLPGELQTGASGWRALVDSALDEGKEEVVQGVIERAMQNLAYQKKNPLASVKNPDAVFNPLTAAEEFAGGAAVGGILSGGQIAANRVLSGVDAHVRGTLDMMQRAAGLEAAQEATQRAPGARQASGAGVDTAQAQSPAEAAQMGHTGEKQTAAPPAGETTVNENGLTALSQLERENLSSGKRNKVVSTFSEAVDFVRNALRNKQMVDRAYLGKVPDSVAKAVLADTGIDIRGYGAIINGNDVRHIIRNHGDPFMETAKGQIRVTPEDIAKIPEILSSPDKVYLSDTLDRKGRKALVFEKQIGDKLITLQGVSDGKKALQTDTLYIQKRRARTARDTMPGVQSDTVPVINAQSEPPQSSSIDFTISQRADSVKPESIMEREIQRLFGGGKRLSPDALTTEPLAAVEAANGQGTVDMDAENRLYQVNPEEHIDRRDIQSAGDKRLRAFQFDHPQLHPYYVQAAQVLSAELEHYIPGGETASRVSEDGNAYSYRMSRSATPRIAELIDRYGVKPGQIGRAIEAIINDRGQENYAAAKRLELMLDEMLTNGYQDALSGETVQPNREYIDLKGKIAGAADRAADMGHGLDGIGAADAGSLNSDYDRLQAQSSRFHPEGANAARPVDVPTQDFDGRNVSKSASTVMGAKAIPNTVIPMIEQMVAEGRMSYDRVSDTASMARARARVQEIGFQGALAEYREAVQAGKASKDLRTLGATLLNNAANAGDGNALAELLMLYRADSTNVAQAQQAGSILRKLSPESQLYGIQRTISDLNKNNEKKDLGHITISQELIQKFLDQTDQEGRDAVMEEILQDAANQLPGSWRGIFDSMRYLSMLFNPRTHIRNLAGNAIFQIPATLKNRVGALGEVTARAMGADVERTKSLTGASPFGALAKEARADWVNAKPFLEGGHYNEGKLTASEIQKLASPFKNVKHMQWAATLLENTLGRLSNLNMNALEAEDAIFKRFIYSQSLAGYLQANGVKSIGQASPELLNRARDYAAQEALRNTFNDKNVVSDAVSSIGKLRNSENQVLRGLSYFTEGALPFKRTPANVAVRAVEYSPVGGGAEIFKTIYDGATGKATAESVSKRIDRIAAGVSGTALFSLGWLLAAAGYLRGGGDDDEAQRNFDDLTGHQKYALELDNGTSVTLDWTAPSAIPLFMGVEASKALEDGKLTPDDALGLLKNMSEPMLQMSMLQGINDLFESAAYAKDRDESVLGALATQAAFGYLSQAFPTAGGQLERAAEDKRMTTYADKNGVVSKDMQFFLGKLSQKVPGWDYHQIPYLDAWGREEETGDALQRAINNLANPAYVSQVRVDQVERELQRLKDATGSGTVFPDRAPRYFTVDGQRKDLTAEEYQKYAKTVGQTQFSLLEKLMKQPGYQRMDDTQRQKAIAAVYEYASGMGKLEVSSWNPDSSSIVKGALKSPLPTETYILYRMFADRDGNGSVSGAESAQTLMELDGLTDKQRGEAWGALNDASAARNPFDGALSKKLEPEDAITAWGIYDRKGTKEEPYTQERKKGDLRQELGLSYIDAAQLYELMKKAAKG